MATATAMYFSGTDPLHKVKRDGEQVYVPKGARQRRLHKAFLRYHDPDNWPLLRDALNNMGRQELIGNGKKHLIPTFQPGERKTAATRNVGKAFRTQHVRPSRGKGARKK